ncbi:unnamed protein product, partial [Musa hybrid cultivar]
FSLSYDSHATIVSATISGVHQSLSNWNNSSIEGSSIIPPSPASCSAEMDRFLPPPQLRSTSWLLLPARPPGLSDVSATTESFPVRHCTTDLNCAASACTHFVTMTLTFVGLRAWSEDMAMAGVHS